MSSKPLPTDQFFKNSGLTPEKAREIVKEGLSGADYGEFYHEIVARERLVKDKGEFTTVSTGDSKEGFGFRVGQEERVGYSYSDLFNEAALKDAVTEARNVLKLGTPKAAQPATGMVPQQLYTPEDPMAGFTLAEKIAKVNEIEAYARSLDPRITNVTVAYASESKAVHIITADGKSLIDNRPMTSVSISIMLTDKDGKSEIGTAQTGGHVDAKAVFDEASFKAAAQKALHQAEELLVAEDAPAGIMDVVLRHAPVIVGGFNYPGHPMAGVAMMCLFTVAVGSVQAALLLRYRSVFLTSFLHASINAQGLGVLPILFTAHPLLGGLVGLVGILVIGAVGVVALMTTPGERAWRGGVLAGDDHQATAHHRSSV